MNIIATARTISPDDATRLVGTTVPEQAANLTDAGIYADADTGAPIVVYAPYPADREQIAAFRQAVRNIRWGTTTRSNGIVNRSRTFGYAPRLPLRRRESCRPTSLMTEAPDTHRILEDAATLLHGWLTGLLPDRMDADRQAVSPVLPDWRIGDDTIWTSGVINLTSELPYHRDGANFKAWSAMPVLRRATRGGHLHIPEYDLTVECRDGWVVCFPGWELVHGVTPISTVRRDGYRISIVYYSLQGTKDCYTFAKETAYGQRRRTEREATMGRPEPDTDDLW